MKVADRKPLRELMERRTTLAELAVVAVLIGLRVNFLASAIPAELGLGTRWNLGLGLGLVLAGFGCLFASMTKHAHRTELFEGLFIIEGKTRVPVRVRRYDLSERLCDFLAAAFSENPALRAQWESDESNRASEGRVSKWGNLLTEVLEYHLLTELSTHLSDFFNSNSHDESRLTTFERQDVPSVLLSNRFLELFSKNTEERPTFHGKMGPSDDGLLEGFKIVKLVHASADNGKALFNHFDLVLPKGSRVSRQGSGKILIDAPRMRIRLEAIFKGFATNLPDEFARRYLHKDHSLELHVLSVKVRLMFEAKTFSVFSPRRFDDYAWVDSFCRRLDLDFSSESFFDRIKWEAALTVAPWLKPDG